MPLHYEKFLKHQQEENHRAMKEAENLWSQYVESDRERDHLGPEHSKLRIYTPVEDYICREDVSGYSKEQLSGTKPKTNASAQDIADMIDRINAPMPSWSSLAVGSHGGATNSEFLAGPTGQALHGAQQAQAQGVQPVSEDANLSKKGQKELARKRAKLYDEVLKAIGNTKASAQSNLKKVAEDLQKFLDSNPREEYEHFLALAESRAKVLRWLVEIEDEEELQNKFKDLSDSEKAVLPCDTQLMHSFKYIGSEAQKILQGESEASCKSQKEKTAASVQMLVP